MATNSALWLHQPKVVVALEWSANTAGLKRIETSFSLRFPPGKDVLFYECFETVNQHNLGCNLRAQSGIINPHGLPARNEFLVYLDRPTARLNPVTELEAEGAKICYTPELGFLNPQGFQQTALVDILGARYMKR